jgi:sec-independent protein translocase protein TatB
MSFQDGIFLFILALLLFGPKRLPVLARELGKWVGEFRRASNEFKMQMEEEMRLSEQADKQKQIAAMEAAAPVAPPLAEPDHPHLPALEAGEVSPAGGAAPAAEYETVDGVPTPVLPIATSGELSIMPPATGLPTPRSGGPNGSHGTAQGPALGGLLDAIPAAAEAAPAQPATEAAVHGD